MNSRKSPQSVHEKRHTSRAQIYSSERLQATVISQKFQDDFLIADFTPFGMGLIIQQPESRVLIENGESIEIRFKHMNEDIIQQVEVANRGTVAWCGKTFTRVGVRFKDTATQLDRPWDRKNQRFGLTNLSSIVCTTSDPLFLNQKAYFRVEDVSVNGLLLSTSARNKFLIPTSRFLIEMSIPSLGLFREEIEVKHVRVSECSRNYRIGCSLVHPSKKTMRALSEYCLLFSESVSIRDLRHEGFPLNFNSQAIQIRSTDSLSDFQQILHLRRRAYGEAGTFGKSTEDPLEKFTDKYDLHSRQIVAKIGDRVIGAGRVVFTGGDMSRSGLKSLVPRMPDFFTGKNFVEFSQLCTHPDYRDGSVLMRLCMEMLRISILDGAQYVAIIARDYMHPTYFKFGFRPFGDWFKIADNNFKYLYADCYDLVRGRGVDFAAWCFMVVPMIRDQNLDQKIEISRMTKFKALIGQHSRPLFQRQLERKTDKKLKKNRQERNSK